MSTKVESLRPVPGAARCSPPRACGIRRVGPVLLALTLLAAAGNAATGEHKKGPDDIGGSDPGKGVNFYSIEKEIALGKQMAQEVEREARIVQDPVVSEYVNRVAQNLVRNSDAIVPFTVKVIDSNEVNAFALPGGFMFVNSGLLLKATNEAEFAGVLAHEIAHVAARHGTKQATRGQLINLASIPLLMVGGWAGFAIQEAAGLAVPLGFLKFSRGMERQADQLGLEYLYKAGYDPTAFVDFFERIESLEKRKPGTVAKVFSTHPMTGDRIKRAQDEIQNELQPRPEYVLDTSEFHDVRQRLGMLQNHRMTEEQAGKPTLRRRTERSDGDDDRPTLKRRD
jgi:predicted Zn-dependent protease